MSGDPDALIVTMKRVASTLKAAQIPFALAGGFAVYARGGPASTHDVDFLIRPSDVQSAVGACVDAGLRSVTPPEDWLVKVYDDTRMVDLIFRPVEMPVTDETLADTQMLSVEAITMPVASATQLMIHKLLSYTQHHCDFATGLPIARSLRELIDWDRVRRETAKSPYAEAFLVLLDRLDVVPFPNGGMK
jgi:hypothetical protein